MNQSLLELRRYGANHAPLSFAQDRLWFLQATAPESPAYNVPLFLRWHEPVDLAALRAALSAVVTRHEVLRTTYRAHAGHRVQVVGDNADVPIDVVALDGVPDALDKARDDAASRAAEPFDLAARPPVRCTVYQGISDGDAVLLCIHHIAVDGWSLAPLLTDLARAYRHALSGEPVVLPRLSHQYSDFAVWDRAQLTDPALARQLSERVAELITVPWDLTLAGATPPGPRRPAGRHVFAVPAGLAARVATMARDQRATPFVVWFAAYTELLRQWSGREDFLVGSMTANRGHPGIEDMVGFFVNTVPLRCRPAPDLTFTELCVLTRAEAMKSLSHQRIPFDRLTADAAARRPEGHGTLVDVGFALQNMPQPHHDVPPPWTPPVVLPTGVAKFDVLLILDQTPDGMTGTIEFDAGRYPADLGTRLAEDYLGLLTAVLAGPERPLGQAAVVTTPRDEPRQVEPEYDGDISSATELFTAVLSEVDRTTGRLGPGSNFFALGGHSLLAMTMLAEAHRRHGVVVRPGEFLANPTVAGLSRLLATVGAAPAVTRYQTSDRVPATSTQQRFWFLDRIPAMRSAYLVPAVAEFLGDVDPERLCAATDRVLARHPALRSRFALDRKDKALYYRVDGPPPVAVVIDARDWDDERVAGRLSAACWTPFDLAAEAPARAEIIVRADHTLLVLSVHHIAADGRAQQVLLDEIGLSYRDDPLPDPAGLVISGDEPEPTRVVAALRGVPTDVAVPHDRPRQRVQSTAASVERVALGNGLADELRAVTNSLGCTMFMVTAALLAAGLARLGDQRDFVFVFPWTGRDVPGSADAVGMFVNTVPLRVDLRGEPSWRALLDRVRAASVAAFRDAAVPFDAVAAAVHPNRDLSRPALTPVYFTVRDGEPTPPDLGPNVTGRLLPLEGMHVKYELELTATETTGDLRLEIAYSTALFDAATVAGLLACVTAAAAELVADPDAPAAKGRRL
ncbi:condensation domain-containing protein [Actinophytocola sp.]|uniref:condensation domain-containing protein n=1 Tax=Actinophytocola sp. TaxID=1872138 RepID=UPI002ED08274